MKTERTLQGFEATVKSSGKYRMGGAAFLSVWLLIWTAGEFFALSFLIWGGWSLFTGRPPGEGRAPLETGPSLAAGIFLLAWLAFWTFGGVLAWSELLRILFGKDRILARTDGLEIERGYGLFRTRQSVRRDQLIRFYLTTTKKHLAAETTNGTVTVALLGSSNELADLAHALNTEYGLSAAAPTQGILPESWREEMSLEGEPTLLKNPGMRRNQAIAAWLIFLPLALVAGYLLNATRTQNSLGALAAIVGSAAILAGWGAYRLWFYRDEWTLAAGRLTLQRRVHGKLRPRFTADALQLREDKDSDGDPWFRLFAVQADAMNAATLNDARKFERQVGNDIGDATELRSFGLWLSHRCKLPFTDRTTTQAKAEDFEALKAKLAASGRIGQFASRLLGRVRPG